MKNSKVSCKRKLTIWEQFPLRIFWNIQLHSLYHSQQQLLPCPFPLPTPTQTIICHYPCLEPISLPTRLPTPCPWQMSKDALPRFRWKFQAKFLSLVNHQCGWITMWPWRRWETLLVVTWRNPGNRKMNCLDLTGSTVSPLKIAGCLILTVSWHHPPPEIFLQHRGFLNLWEAATEATTLLPFL